MLMSGIQTMEAQVIKVNDTEASAKDEMEIVVTANADISNYVAVGFYIELPEDFSIAGVEGVRGYDVLSNHIVRVGQVGGSKIRVAVYSLGNSPFSIEGGNVQTLCTLKLKAPNKEGTFTGQMTGVEFATTNNALIKGNGLQFGITLKPGEKGLSGDADGNGYVEADDIAVVVNYILTGEDEELFFENADLNNDKKVDAADLVLLIKKVKNINK